MSAERKRVVIAGGGISGLTAAYYIQRNAAAQGIRAELMLIEADDKPGGKIRTLRQDGMVIEKGPDSFLARKLPIIELSQDLGLVHELVATNPKANKTYILHRGKLHRMPPGLVLGIPTRLAPFVGTGLVSPVGKARAAMDLILPRRREDGDESLGAFLERRLGREVLAHIAEPLLAGIYAGDTHHLSLQSTFPQFQEAEQRDRSLILGMIKNKKRGGAPVLPDALPPVARRSVFLTYRHGLSSLVEALLTALSGMKRLSGTRVETLNRTGERYSVELSNGERIEADAVVLAVPAFAAARALSAFPGAGYLGAIPYVSVANVVMAFDRQDIRYTLDGSGFVIPRTEGTMLTACTWTSVKWLHTAPENRAILRCYIGRSGAEVGSELSDGRMVEQVRREIASIMGVTAEPLFTEVSRWSNAMPQYPVGHLERLRELEEYMSRELPGVCLAGAGYRGVGIPDCIKQGREAADRTLRYLEQAASRSCG